MKMIEHAPITEKKKENHHLYPYIIGKYAMNMPYKSGNVYGQSASLK